MQKHTLCLLPIWSAFCVSSDASGVKDCSLFARLCRLSSTVVLLTL